MIKISPSRVAAFQILVRIEREKSFSSILLPAYESELSEADRALCHEIVLGTLRRQMQLDRVIDHLSGGKKLDAVVRIAIRIGLYQLMFLDRIPDYSLVNDSVNLVKMAGKTSAKGFANAILRRAAREKVTLNFTDEIDQLSVETSHPRWLLEKWVADFGMELAAKIAAANNESPPYAFRSLNDGPVDIAAARRSEFVEGAFMIDKLGNDPGEFAKKNNIYFQDEGSQLVARSVSITENGRFLDVCAAPGGKTGLIAHSSASSHATIIAGDLYWKRVIDLRENCKRQGAARVSIVQYDAESALPFAEKGFNTVFVDAPCSGTGTIRHNPELRYFLEPSDISEVSKKQLNILGNASKLVNGGGSLIYSTCSLEIEENETVCNNFIANNEDFSSIEPRLEKRFITSDGFARTYPHRDGMDGFFIAEFRRR